MRPLLVIAPLLLAACGGAQAEQVEFTPTKGKVVRLTVNCEIVPPAEEPGEAPDALKTGPCNQILPEARKYEFREAAVHRKLDITFVYTSPVDHGLHEVTSQVRRSIGMPVPRPGDQIDVMAHPAEAGVATIE